MGHVINPNTAGYNRLAADLRINQIVTRGEKLKALQEEAREMNRTPIQILESECKLETGEDVILFEVVGDGGDAIKGIDGVLVTQKDIDSGAVKRIDAYNQLGHLHEAWLKENCQA